MTERKLSLVGDAPAYFQNDVQKSLPVAQVLLGYGQQREPEFQYQLGELHTGLSILKTTLTWTTKSPYKGKEGDSKYADMLGQTLTRAGFLRPRFSPFTWQRLLQLREDSTARVEFVLDTNALVSGAAVWLGEIFSDGGDLLMTQVSSEEIQDAYEPAKFCKPATEQNIDRRHLYLSAQRFREYSGHSKAKWLPMDLLSDETLQLASGCRDNKKSSSADTAILRATHRLIENRVRGLWRFLVTGDVALARRAQVELPRGTVLLFKTEHLAPDTFYAPCLYWPGPDEGCAVLFPSSVKLLWELLALCDFVTLRPKEGSAGPTYTFCGFQKEMWLEDFEQPWVSVNMTPAQFQNRPVPMDSLKAPAPIAPQGHKRPADEPLFELHAEPSEPSSTSPAASASPLPQPLLSSFQGLGVRLFETQSPHKAESHLVFDRNVRFQPDRLLDLLFCLTQTTDNQNVPVPHWLLERSEASSRHYRALLLGLRLADSPHPGKTFRLLAESATLRQIWEARDVEALAQFFRRYQPFAEQLDHDPGTLPKRPLQTAVCARSLAVLFGQIVQVKDQFFRGNENPTFDEVRHAIEAHFQRDRLEPSFSMYELFVEVFLRKLHVSPARAMAAWPRMEQAGVFAGFEFRTGGTPDLRRTQTILELGPTGWKTRDILFDEFEGKRDVVDVRPHHV